MFRRRFLVRSVVAVVALAALAWSCGPEPTDLRASIRFHNAPDLEVGDDVRIGGLRVGEVKNIDFDGKDRIVVVVIIEGAYRDQVTSDAKFRIKRESLISSERYVELNPGSEKPVPTEDPFFIGEMNWVDMAQDWADATKTWVTSEEVRDAFREFADAVGDAASRGWAEWQAQKPTLEEKARLLFEMAREKAPAIAERLREEIEKLMDEAEKELSRRDPNAEV